MSKISALPVVAAPTPAALVPIVSGGVTAQTTIAGILIAGFAAGVVGTPSMTFVLDSNTGLWNPGTGIVAVSGDGLEVVRFQAPGGASPQILAATAVSGLPSYSWATTPTTGIAQNGAGGIVVTISGTSRLQFHGNQLLALTSGFQFGMQAADGTFSIIGAITTTATPSVSFDQNVSFTASTAIVQRGTRFTYILNQTSTAGFSAVQINLTNTALGSGSHYFLDCQVAGVTVAGITNGSTAAKQGRMMTGTGDVTNPGHGFLGNEGYGLYLTAGTVRCTSDAQNVWSATASTMAVEKSLAVAAGSPAAMATVENNYALSGSGGSTRSFVRLTPNAANTVITGFADPVEGRWLILVNLGAGTITISHQDAASTAANRIITSTGAAVVLSADDTATFIYDATTARWRQITAAA